MNAHLYQHDLIDRVRRRCADDDGLDAALMYGSFVKDEADQYSDIEFWLFHTPAAAAALDPFAWCDGVEQTTAVLRNEFGAHVALFPGLIRGEFHFATTDDLPLVATWPERAAPVERMIVLDRRGELAPRLAALPEQPATPAAPDDVARACEPLANWLILARNVLERGETLRAWDALSHAQRHLTWIARLAENTTDHWLTPSRAAERELTPRTLTALAAATAPADRDALRAALRAALAEGRRHWQTLADRHGFTVPGALLDELAAALDTAP
jgi:lincosamide nucleotidyltransferase B/F